MSGMLRRIGAGLIVISVVGLGCTSGAGFFTEYWGEIYIGGQCKEDADCHSVSQDIPGSFCKHFECACDDGQDKCCPGGQWDEMGNPLNCKLEGDYRCRLWDECHPPPPPPPPPECVTAADCPPPPDLRCGQATCKDGKCGLLLDSSNMPIHWQYPGDCKTAYCDETGNVVLKDDPADIPKTVDPCLKDSCENSEPINTPLPDGALCIDTTGFCDTLTTPKGPTLSCVQCMWPDNTPCPPGEGCILGKCVPEHCADFIKNGDETYKDCGGSCTPCQVNELCLVGSDCYEGVCVNSHCLPPEHDDGVKNDGETGIDCGCEKCAACPDGEGCLKPENCASGVCYIGVCQVPTCFDMVQNAAEEGVDCGGECELTCPMQSSG